MNVLNMIPIAGWIIAAVNCFFVAIPFSLLWNWLAPTYFYWLPQVYLNIPFFDFAGLIWLIVSLQTLLLHANNKGKS